MKVKSESEVAQSCPTLSDPMDCTFQAPPSMEFSRQEYWSGVPLASLHLELDPECEVQRALRSRTMCKTSGGDGIAIELFQILKDEAVKVLHSIC